MLIDVIEILAIVMHFVSLILGGWVLHRHKDILTRVNNPRKSFFHFDFIEAVSWTITLSTICNLWFVFNQIDWMTQGYSEKLDPTLYLKWMSYHLGTGISVTMLHFVIHCILEKDKNYKDGTHIEWNR